MGLLHPDRQTNITNQPDVVIVNNNQKSLVINKKKEHEKLKECQGLKEELKKIQEMKTKLVPVVL